MAQADRGDALAAACACADLVQQTLGHSDLKTAIGGAATRIRRSGAK
jgi:cobalamin biosynthesis protein CobT